MSKKPEATKPQPATADTVEPEPTTSKPSTATTVDKHNMNLYQKIAAITGELKALAKEGTNKEQGYAFIEYSQVAAELRAKLAAYGLVILPTVLKHEQNEFKTRSGGIGYHTLVTYKIELINADSPTERHEAEWIGEATDYSDKATNKASTAAEKYYLMRVFKISDKGDDPDLDTPGSAPTPVEASPATGQEFAAIFRLLEYLGVDDATRKQLVAKVRTSKQALGMIGELKIKALNKKKADEDAAAAAVETSPVDPEASFTPDELGAEAPATEPEARLAVTDEVKLDIEERLSQLGLKTSGEQRFFKLITGKPYTKSFDDTDWLNLSKAIDDILNGINTLPEDWYAMAPSTREAA